MTTATVHHAVRVHQRGPVERPARLPTYWAQTLRAWTCGYQTGHCWHPEVLIDWWCCMCAAMTDGWPPQRCVHCTGPG